MLCLLLKNVDGPFETFLDAHLQYFCLPGSVMFKYCSFKGVVSTGGKLAAGVVDTAGAP
jgi:hypothetical protein